MNQKTKRKGSKKIVWRIKIPKLETVEVVDYLLLFSTLLGSILIPLTFSNNFEYPVVFPKYLLLIIYTVVSTALLVSKSLITKRKGLVQNSIITTVAFFLLVYITSSIFSPSPITSLIGERGDPTFSVLSVICYTLSLVNITNSLERVKFVKYLSWTLLAAAVILNISLILLIISEKNLDLLKFYNVSPLGNINHHLLYNIFIIPIIISLFDSIEKLTLKISLFIFVILLLLSLLLTQNLLIWILLSLIPIFSLMHSSLPKKLISFKSALLATNLAVVIAIPILRRDFILNFGKHASSILNLGYSKKVLNVFSGNALFGVGPQMLDQSVHTQFLNPALNTYIGGIYLKLSATTGVIATLLILVTLFIITKSIIMNFKKFRSPLSGYIISLVIFLISTLFFIPSIPQIFLAILSLSILIRFTTNNSTLVKKQKIRLTSILVLLIISTTLIGITLRFRSSEVYAYKAAINQNNSGQSIIYNSKAIRRNSSHEDLHIRQAKYLLNFLNEHPDFKNEKEIVRQIRFSYARAISINPQNHENYLEAAKINYTLDAMYPNSGYQRITNQYVEKALKLNPNSLEAVLIQTEINRESAKN